MRITRYITQLLIEKIIVTMMILGMVLWTIKSLRIVDTIISKGMGILDFGLLSLFLLPHILYIITPFAVLVGFVIIYKFLENDNELIALKALGFSKIQIFTPYLLTFIIFTVFGLFISNFLLPISYKQFQEIAFKYQNYYLAAFLEEKTFNNDIKGVTFYVKHKENERFEGFFINNHRSHDKNISIFAEYGILQKNGDVPSFTLYNGVQFEKKKNGSTSALKFDVYNLVIDQSHELKKLSGVEHQEESITELLATKRDNPDYNKKLSIGMRRLLWPLLSVVVPSLMFAVLINGESSRRFNIWPVLGGGLALFTTLLGMFALFYLAEKNWRIMFLAIIIYIAIITISLFFIRKERALKA